MKNSARDWAILLHRGQSYGVGRPYSYHLEQVVNVLRRFNYNDETLIAAAWLHDAIEDQSVKEVEIAERFGEEVASIVWAVTSPDLPTRAEKFKVVFEKIKQTPEALVVKLADRIANVEACIADRNLEKLQKYLTEHDTFYTELKDVNTKASPLWQHLQSLVKQETENA